MKDLFSIHCFFALIILASSNIIKSSETKAVQGFKLSDLSGVHVLGHSKDSPQHRRLSDDGPLRLQFSIEGVDVDVDLNKMQRSAFSKGLKVTKHVTEFNVPVDVPTYESLDRSVLINFFPDGTVEGLVTHDDIDRTLHIRSSTDGRRLHILNSSESIRCGVMDHDTAQVDTYQPFFHRRKLTVNSWAGTNECYPGDEVKMKLNVGIVIGSRMYEKLTSDDAVFAYLSAMIAKTNLVYELQLNIVIYIDHIYIQLPSMSDPSPNWNNGLDIELRLNKLILWGAPSEQAAWHIIDDMPNFDAGTAGIASKGTICQVGDEHGGRNRGANWHHDDIWGTFAHELGHNFGASHSFEDTKGETGGIMDYGGLENKRIDGSHQFNTYRREEVCSTIRENIVTEKCSGFGQKIFSAYEPICGNGIIEEEETCECGVGKTSCDCCTSCQLEEGKMCTPLHDSCCTSSCMWASHATECDSKVTGQKGYCAQGTCTTDGVVCPMAHAGGVCGVDSCRHSCIDIDKFDGSGSGLCKNVDNWTTREISHRDQFGNPTFIDVPAGRLRDGTYCETADCFVGSCQEGECVKDHFSTEHCAANPDVTIVNSGPGISMADWHEDNRPTVVEFAETGCTRFGGKYWDLTSDLGHGLSTHNTLKGCYDKCLQNDECHSFDYDNEDMTRATGICVLYSAAVAHESLLSKGPASQVSAYICRYHGDNALAETCDIHRNRVFSSSPDLLGSSLRVPVGTCWEHCLETPQCKYISYNKDEGTCNFYSFMFSDLDLELTEENIDTYGCKLGGENNMCACTGGTAVEGRECPKNGWEMCESCDEPNVIRVLITEGEGAGHIVCETNCRFEYGGENTCDTEIEDGGTCSSATSKGMDCTGCKHCSDHKGEYPYACNSEYDAPDERGCCGGDGRENCPFFFGSNMEEDKDDWCSCQQERRPFATWNGGGFDWHCSCINCRAACSPPAPSPSPSPSPSQSSSPSPSPSPVCADINKKRGCKAAGCLWGGNKKKCVDECSDIRQKKTCKSTGCLWGGKKKKCVAECSFIAAEKDCTKAGCRWRRGSCMGGFAAVAAVEETVQPNSAQHDGGTTSIVAVALVSCVSVTAFLGVAAVVLQRRLVQPIVTKPSAVELEE